MTEKLKVDSYAMYDKDHTPYDDLIHGVRLVNDEKVSDWVWYPNHVKDMAVETKRREEWLQRCWPRREWHVAATDVPPYALLFAEGDLP